jgi:hypothetical protein
MSSSLESGLGAGTQVWVVDGEDGVDILKHKPKTTNPKLLTYNHEPYTLNP